MVLVHSPTDLAAVYAELVASYQAQEKLVAALREAIASLEAKNAALESSLVNHACELELLRRKLYGVRSERGGTSEQQLLLGELLEGEAELRKQLDELPKKGSDGDTDDPSKPDDGKQPNRPQPKGRRDLSTSKLPKVVVEITDAELAAKGTLIDYETSRQLARRQGGFYVLVKRVAKYRVPTEGGTTKVEAAESPRLVIRRGLMHTSLLAWIAVQKFGLGVPHHRLEQSLVSEGAPLDRSVMCRNMEEVGSALGATVVHAMLEHARSACQVLSTDATGAAIQPGSRDGGPKRPCAKGHFFTIVADRDHVLFEYVRHHTSDAVSKLFAGFRGYLQSDASSVYDVLERGPPSLDEPSTKLVGCWAHCRRYFFEAAICKYRMGLEGLQRIRAIYAADAPLAKLPPSERKARRAVQVAPLIDDFFAWVAGQSRVARPRDLAAKAVGYASRQEVELRRVLDDGRLPLDNTRSERALRTIVVGRKNWLFYGSDVHAQAAAALFGVLASCRLHGIEPVQYLDEVLRLLPYWPKDRFLELSPLRWPATRARLSATELEAPLGHFTVPPPLGG